MAQSSGTSAAVNSARRGYRDAAEVQAPKLRPGSKQTTFRAAVGKAVKTSHGTATSKQTINDVAQQALATQKPKSRQSHDRARIIINYARQVRDDGQPADKQALHSPLNLASHKTGKDKLQRVLVSSKRYRQEAKTVAALRDNMFEGRLGFAFTLGALLQEDSSEDTLKTTLESLATEVEPYTEKTAHQFRALSAKLDEIKEMRDQCSSLVDRVRPIPGTVARANATSDPGNTQVLEDELKALEVPARELSMQLRSLESEYDCFRKAFMSFQPTVLPVCQAGHTMAWTRMPKDQTLCCEQCHTPSRIPLSKNQDPVASENVETSWQRNVRSMWHCVAPDCNENLPIYLCWPCGKTRFNPNDHWLSCLALPLEWERVKEDAYIAIERTTAALHMERRTGEEEKKQEDAEEQQEKHQDDQQTDVAKVEPARSMNPPLISTADTSLAYSSEDGQLMRASAAATTNNSACLQSETSGAVSEEEERQNSENLRLLGERHINCLRDLSQWFASNSLEALEARRASASPYLSGSAGPLAPFSQRSATPEQPATRSSSKSGRQSVRGNLEASSSGSYQRDSNLAALRGTGVVATFTVKARRGSRANSSPNQELLEEEVDARSNRVPAARHSLPASELRRLCGHPRPKSHSSSNPRRSLLHEHLLQGSTSTPSGQPSSTMGRTAKPARQSGNLSIEQVVQLRGIA